MSGILIKEMKKKLYITGIAICAIVFCISLFKIADYRIRSNKANDEFAHLLEIVEKKEEQSPLKKYMELYKQNNDMAGWISIEDTKINYPVMYAPDNPGFYLKHNFEKESSDYGVPYIAEQCNPTKPSDNIIIYGHHMKNGTMFAGLMDYENEEFYKEHKIIHFNTLNQIADYEIIAVLTTEVNNKGFKYYLFTDAKNTKDFNSYVEECKKRSLYDIEVMAEYGDKLITLSTCEDAEANRRMVVVAKKITNSNK